MTLDHRSRGAATEVSPDLFKAVVGSVCTPVAVMTAFDGTRQRGTTVSALPYPSA